MVDNCYGEFVETIEPSDVGADMTVGSLIKNPGGGLTPTGGYIVGGKEYIDLIGTIFDTNAIIDFNRFLSGIEYCIGGFQENYNLSDSYQSPTTNNFNYNWKEFFDIFGIEYK